MSSDEERAQDRELRGFETFSTLKQLQDWKIEEVDDLKRANTPLLERPKDIPEAIKKPQSSNIMLMHDYRRNYLHNGYEGCQGAIVGPIVDKGEDYVLEQWQRVEVFNYFSHYRASIPPPSWVNAGHRNGALVLGTIMLENQDDEPKLILEKDRTTNEYWFAERLFQMAKHYGFDGWLLNLELHESEEWKEGLAYKNAWDKGIPFMEMLRSLKRKLESLPGNGKLIWYESHTTKNPFVAGYANTLNGDNKDIAKAAGSMVTNYEWDLPTEVEPAVTVANDKESKIPLNTVYFGIDTFAQISALRSAYGLNLDKNGTFSAGHGKGHGGTATGLAVKVLAERGLGAGIFAPGWAYEHWKEKGAGGRQVDRYMWDGLPDLKTAAGVPRCGCDTGLDQHILDDSHIAHYAKQYPAGSESFFHTDFTAASYSEPKGGHNMNISRQSVLPTPENLSKALTVTPVKTAESRIELRFEPSLRASIDIFIKAGENFGPKTHLDGVLLLYHCNVRGELKLDLSITYRRRAENPEIDVHLRIKVGGNSKELDLPVQSQWKTLTMSLQDTRERITAIGIAAKGPAHSLGEVTTKGSTFSLLEISSISLKPSGQSYPTNISIQGLHVLERGNGKALHHRLKWSYRSATKPDGFLMPWSDVTGPFSHFEISVEKQLQGRAYALQFILDETSYKKKKKVHVDITGYAFDGTAIGFLKDQEITLV